MSKDWIDALINAMPTGLRVLRDEHTIQRESRDETEDLHFPPDVVVEPTTTAEVAALMQWASAHRIPVTAAGARTGLSGGALAVQGGIALSMRRMDSILEVDERNLQVRVQPGVIVERLQDAVAEKGLFYAVDPEDPVPLGVTSPKTAVGLGPLNMV
jgi:glycolate oxidase